MGQTHEHIEGTEDSEYEKIRVRQILELLPRNRHSVLEIGSRSGKITRVLAEKFSSVTALDLVQPSFQIDRVTAVSGDVTELQFPENSFDCVLCTEVLEHVPNIKQACEELVRVTRHELVIGVPFEQDLRVGRLNCSNCRRINPSWGHVNSFSEARLRELFSLLRLKTVVFCGLKRERTNWFAMTLCDLARNPWGTYDQEEPCIYCCKKMDAPQNRTLFERACGKLGMTLYQFQNKFTAERPIWIHLVFSKE